MKKSLKLCVILFVSTLLLCGSAALAQETTEGAAVFTESTQGQGVAPPAPLAPPQEPATSAMETEGTGAGHSLLGSSAEEAGKEIQKWVNRIVPPSWRKVGWVLPHYQWVLFAFLVFCALVVGKVARIVLSQIIERGFKKRNFVPEEVSAEWLAKPAGFIVVGTCLTVAVAAVRFPEGVKASFYLGIRLFVLCCTTWLALRLTEVIARYALQRLQRRQANYYAVIIPLLSRTAKILIFCIGAISCAEALSLPVTALLGGLGIGGMAFAFAAKDGIANVFGSFTVVADRPFEVGDWIITNNCEGTVEVVGIRSTRIRTFDHSVITIPNNLLVTTIVNNMGKRRFRRHKTTLSLTYSTSPEKVEDFCAEVEKNIAEHPATSKDMPVQVAFYEMTAYSLDIFVNYFLQVPGRPEELVARQEVLLGVMRTASKMNVDFAFPTQSIEILKE